MQQEWRRAASAKPQRVGPEDLMTATAKTV